MLLCGKKKGDKIPDSTRVSENVRMKEIESPSSIIIPFIRSSHVFLAVLVHCPFVGLFVYVFIISTY